MSDPYLGEIRIFGCNFAPVGWAFCNGQILPIAQHSALFSLLGTTFGGDGQSTFALPDLRGRVAVHPGNGPGLPPVTWGQKGGQASVTLNANNLPPHSHALRCSTDDGETDEPAGLFPAKAGGGETIYGSSNDAAMASGAIGNTGSGQSFSNMPPFVGIYYCIALTGIFPSPN